MLRASTVHPKVKQEQGSLGFLLESLGSIPPLNPPAGVGTENIEVHTCVVYISNEHQSYLSEPAVFEVLFELVVLMKNSLHAVSQLGHFSLQHEFILPCATELFLHHLQLHLYPLQIISNRIQKKRTITHVLTTEAD